MRSCLVGNLFSINKQADQGISLEHLQKLESVSLDKLITISRLTSQPLVIPKKVSNQLGCKLSRMGTIPGKIFLVTGPPGVGKTTLITRVFESLKSSMPDLKIQGFLTREIREGNERVGFQVVTLDGRTAPLASSSISHPDSYRWPAVGKYKVDVKSFESVALPEMQIREDTDLFIIDEVGKMELFSRPFIDAVERVLELNVPLLASIPQPKYSSDPPIVAKLRSEPRATIFTLHPSNRDAAKNEVFIKVVDSLHKP